MYTLDTNILIYHAASEPFATSFFEERHGDVFYVPSIAIAEFLSYPLINEIAVSAFRSFISQTIIVNLDVRVAELAAEVRKKYHVKLLDAVVAATAFSTNSVLVTKDAHFKKIKGLPLFEF
ncbi:MAG: hypothetical protein COV91_03050 [Candidatus Taylorbacteria bacterium CG11_big_fil_rev_8_21_14_0_20_46_11]|uniref:PIN domain-containing protein n=1 Tax=Candidatus Taylorbacteria bacterium CG11_big_fil_rev_8_21_14_0_20_46_11 TaxID=1975025 RepID=A0A2H0KBK4_9BACT|nr:MAG: hypothetical protein COV91_03050 [Candidatus Taylorbacteria bacterium CG11_big_fil_rev_8_21_14_0_20_46_11]